MTSPKKTSKLVTTRRIGEQKLNTDETDQVSVRKPKKAATKKVIYLEIDDEITAIYDRIKDLKINSVYIVVPKRAIIFQSIINLKILKRKADELGKNIYIITNDQNGIHLAKKIGLNVYDKLEGHEHPSLVSGKFFEEQQDITPLKASINTLEDSTPMRRTEKKFSISDFVKRDNAGKIRFMIPKLFSGFKNSRSKDQKKFNQGKLVLVAPNRQALISLVVISLIILLTITYIALPGATITLVPKASGIDTSANVTLADIELNKAELDTNVFHMIPSYSITKKIDKVLTYQATGKDFKGANASGTLTVYNKSDHDWTLLEKTRFQTDTGIVFRSQKGVSVPAARAGKPGSLDITVVADPADAYNQVVGEKGNIGPTTLFLPGLSEENRKKVYAENKTSFSGGTTSVTKHITDKDLEAARNEMITDLKASAQAELEAYLKERNNNQKTNLVLLTGNNVITMGDPVVTIPPGLVGLKKDNFEVSGSMVVTGTAYSKDDLTAILKTELKLKKNPEKKLVYIQDDSLTYRIIEQDAAAKKIKITATIKGIEEYEVNPEKENGDRLIKKIKEHIIGKNIKEAETYIQNLPEIDKVKIDVWPAWAPTLPGIGDNIKIEVANAN